MADLLTKVELERKTKETEIKLKLNLAGEGDYDIDTGIGFFDHMLELFCCHGFFDMGIKVNGDLYVDEHHTIEDVGIVLGQAIKKAVGDKAGIRRYGDVTLPMDETLVQVVLDLSGRPYYLDDLDFAREMVGDFPVELFGEFFRALTNNCGMNLHIRMIRSGNAHHLIEGCFKAFGRALDQALSRDDRLGDKPMSTKGSLKEGENL
ncbi:MAG: imidazoleglycerol-phosphate dehydratase HisB [Halanaerobiaceae bacterium]